MKINKKIEILIKDLLEQAKKDQIQKYVVGGLILNGNGEILLLKRTPTEFMPNLVELPSGNLENNETLFQALQREIKEETNLEISEILNFIDTFDYKSGSGKNARQFNFLVKVDSTENLRINKDEHQSYYWLNKDLINSTQLNISEAVKNTIKKAIQ